jgi:hypothetical protein
MAKSDLHRDRGIDVNAKVLNHTREMSANSACEQVPSIAVVFRYANRNVLCERAVEVSSFAGFAGARAVRGVGRPRETFKLNPNLDISIMCIDSTIVRNGGGLLSLAVVRAEIA